MSPEDAFIVTGGKPMNGSVSVSGAKNVALKVVIAALMLQKPVTLKNIPHIKDIEELLTLISDLGGKWEFVSKNTLLVDGTSLVQNKVDLLYGSKIRVSFMMFAPLLYRLGTALIPNPGGCRIGARSIDRTIDMMKQFGVQVQYNSKTGYYSASRMNNTFTAIHYRFDKKTHTGTELALLFAACADGTTMLDNCALEPEIDDLIAFLNMNGAKIKRAGDSIMITGVQELSNRSSKGEFTIMGDRNEAVTYAVLAMATKGDITVHGADAAHLGPFVEKVREAGGGIEEKKNAIRFFYKKDLQHTYVVTLPHPGFMTDWQAPWAVLMTQAQGKSTLHETVFENRFGYVKELKKMGASITFFQPELEDPHHTYQFKSNKNKTYKNQAIEIVGNTPLHNAVLKVTDMRAGASLIIAALIAPGESVVDGATIIDRGYEDIVEKLSNLGASIRRV